VNTILWILSPSVAFGDIPLFAQLQSRIDDDVDDETLFYQACFLKFFLISTGCILPINSLLNLGRGGLGWDLPYI
jgi:hypothetical protein